MKRSVFLQTLCSGISLIATPAVAQQQDKPNIVVILADDLGTNELGCYGGKNLQTPHIDRLANEGIFMTNNYASCTMSVPIRASLYTGLYPARHGSYQNHKASYNNLKSTPHYLSDLGYRVGRTGKDHPANQPGVYAFEKIPGFTVDCVASKPAAATPDGITEFIQRNGQQPFCLYVCSINSHMPWDAGDASEFDPDQVVLPPNCVDNARTRKDFCNYLAEIRMLDNEVGMVMDALKKTGKLDNTLVIFLGEQGPQMPFGKWTCYRYGQNSAFIARYPSGIAQGTKSDALVQYEDILPTMIDFAGGEPIDDLDGMSCLDVLLGQREEHRQWAYGIHNNIPEGPSYPIRSIQDKRYKLIVNLNAEANYHEKHMMATGDNMWNSWLKTAETDEKAKFLTGRFVQRPAIELYDLREDKWELTNIVDHPEHTERIKTMRVALDSWMEQQGDRGVLMDTDNPEDPSLKPPLAIRSIDDINKYVRNDLNGNYYLANDIEISEGTEWIPIGAASPTDSDPQRFKGIFDGKGHCIKGLKISTESAFKGLFGRLDYAVVKDFDLIDVDIQGKAPSGGVTGAMIGSSKIERVSVSGTIKGDTEVGGIVGRIARDAIHTDYNIIHDCYVSANIRATSQSTNMNTPSCAGGIAALIHSNTNATNVAKLDIQRVYFTGSVVSEQMTNIAGNAAAILAFTDNNPSVKMNEVLVLADEITAATPNYFYCRRLPTSNNKIEFMEKLYVRDGLTLKCFSDGGVGVLIPEGVITALSVNTFKTAKFYADHSTWDFENVWSINEGEYPKLKREQSGSVSVRNEELNYKITSNKNGLEVQFEGLFSVTVYDLTGKNILKYSSAYDQIFIPINKGIYIVKIQGNTLSYTDKVAVS